LVKNHHYSDINELGFSLGENIWKAHGNHNWSNARRDSRPVPTAPPAMLPLSLQ